MSHQSVCSGSEISTILMKDRLKPFYEALFTTQSTITLGRHGDNFSKEWLEEKRTKFSHTTSMKSDSSQWGK